MNKALVKNAVTLLIILIGAAIVVTGFIPPHASGGFDLPAFGKLPVQFETRVLPIDSVARNTMRMFSERTTLYVPSASGNPDEKVALPALEWFLDLALRPEIAEKVKVFRVDHDEVLGLLGQKQLGAQLFSFLELQPHFADIEKAAQTAIKKQQAEQKLSLFEDEVLRLANNLQLFEQLAQSFVPPGADPDKTWELWQATVKPGAAAVLAKEAGKPVDEDLVSTFSFLAKNFMDFDKAANVGLIPPPKIDDKWSNLGHGALDALHADQVSPILIHYGELGAALRKNDAGAFNTAVTALQQDLARPEITSKVRFEAFINNVEPFFRGAFLYVFAFLCACISWVAWGPELRRAALGMMIFGFTLHTLGLAARVYLTGYGVVTSLVSAMQFMGWIAVLAGLVLELLKKRGVGAAASSFVGFAALVVAHSLPFGGDDLELPRAVLATNFWLWTHVTCINIGCGAMFVAGALGIGYILARAFSTGFVAENRRLLAQFVYGVTCFATLFSFVGTMLGGIWADQSWGRFWGWDPRKTAR